MNMPPQQQGPGAPPVQNMSQQNLNQIVRVFPPYPGVSKEYGSFSPIKFCFEIKELNATASATALVTLSCYRSVCF
jgi:hypothetical protein